MAVLLGIDLGTSGVKVSLLDSESSRLIGTASGEYGVETPAPGWAEQSPEAWWSATVGALKGLHTKAPAALAAVSAVGFSGQMHGLVTVDAQHRPVRPAIIWLDQRAGKQLAQVQALITPLEMRMRLLNRVSMGFALPSLLWLRANEPENYARIHRIMLPKDYIRMKITGEIASDASDASGTAMFDAVQRSWAWPLIERMKLRADIFPDVRESTSIAGAVTAACARETGLPQGAKVVFGAGDQPCYSIGNGIIRPGLVAANIGSSGQVSAYSDVPCRDEHLRTQTFCHAIRRGYTVFGATLCAGMSLNWLRHKILHAADYDAMTAMAAQAPAGAEGLLYLPYLTGERTPHMDPRARGAFFGLTLRHDDRYLIRAVMEGVVFSLRDSLNILTEMGLGSPEGSGEIIASGAGAKSHLWLQMQADILNRPVRTCAIEEQASLGACILAGLGAGAFNSPEEACDRLVRYQERVHEPDPRNQAVYQEAYARYRALYLQTRPLL